MRQILQLSLKAFTRKNRAAWLTGILLIFVTTLLFSTVAITQLHQQNLWEARGNIYGYFYSIVYQGDEAAQTAVGDSIGQIHVFNAPNENASVKLLIGYANPAAEHLMYRGTDDPYTNLPAGTCAISESLAHRLCISVGNTLSIGSNELKVNRVSPDIGHLWIRGES